MILLRERLSAAVRCPVCREPCGRETTCSTCRTPWHPDCHDGCPVCALGEEDPERLSDVDINEVLYRLDWRDVGGSDYGRRPRWAAGLVVERERATEILRDLEGADLEADGPLSALLDDANRIPRHVLDRVPAEDLDDLARWLQLGLDEDPLRFAEVYGELVRTPAGTVLHVDDGQCHAWYSDPSSWRDELDRRTADYQRDVLAGEASGADAYSDACSNTVADWTTLDWESDLSTTDDAVQLAVCMEWDDDAALIACREAILTWCERGHPLRLASGEALRRRAEKKRGA